MFFSLIAAAGNIVNFVWSLDLFFPSLIGQKHCKLTITCLWQPFFSFMFTDGRHVQWAITDRRKMKEEQTEVKSNKYRNMEVKGGLGMKCTVEVRWVTERGFVTEETDERLVPICTLSQIFAKFNDYFVFLVLQQPAFSQNNELREKDCHQPQSFFLPVPFVNITPLIL